ncbi:WD40 repeat domain-containing protein [Candidatus Poribacteria bacterium]|nr:WD40 repeat domain-containing protein [Candidatus Poribacteria bacterium]
MKKTKLFYIVCLLIPCLLLSNGFAQKYAARWNLPEGAKARLGKGRLKNIILSPDGSRVAISTPIGIWVYDANTGEAVSLFSGIQTGEVEKFLPMSLPEALTFSADALIIASAHGNRIYVWDTATGTAFAMLDKHPDVIKAIALSPDNTKLATAGGDWIVRLWEVRTGKYLYSLIGHPSAVNAVAFSPDGKILASAGSSLRLWDADTGELLHVDHNDLGSISEIVFAPDGNTLATGGGWYRTAQLWDVKTGALQKSLKGHTGKIRDIAFSPDSRTLVTASSDKTMRLWDVNTGIEQQELPTAEDKFNPLIEADRRHQLLERDDVHTLKFSKDGTRLVSGSGDGSLHLWDVATGRYELSISLGEHTTSWGGVLAFSEDGKYLASNDGLAGRIRVWNVANATQHAILTPGEPNFSIFTRFLTVSPGIKKFAGHSLHGEIGIWDATTLERLSTVPTERGLLYWPLVFSPDGKLLVSSGGESRSNKVKFWQTDPGVHLFTLEDHTSPVTKYVFSADSKIFASGSEDATVILWDVKTGNQLATLTGHTKHISALAFSTDSKTLASGSGNEIRLWNVHTAALIARLDATENVDALAFTPDDKTFTSGVRKGIIQIWKLGEMPQIVSTFRSHHGSISMLMFSPDGKTLASGGADGTILLWDMEQ